MLNLAGAMVYCLEFRVSSLMRALAISFSRLLLFVLVFFCAGTDCFLSIIWFILQFNLVRSMQYFSPFFSLGAIHKILKLCVPNSVQTSNLLIIKERKRKKEKERKKEKKRLEAPRVSNTWKTTYEPFVGSKKAPENMANINRSMRIIIVVRRKRSNMIW